MKRKNKITLAVLCCLFAAIAAFSFVYIKQINSVRLTENIEESSSSPETTVSESTTEPEAEKLSVCGEKYISEETGRIVVDPKNENWSLIVVNKGREYTPGYKPELAEAVEGSGKYLDKRVAPHYKEMYEAAKKDGLTLTPYSGYRSYDFQKQCFDSIAASYVKQYKITLEEAEKKAIESVLPAGTSEHNLGLAMDISSTKDSFGETEEFKWLCKHAQDYGFILRYTAEKQPITGIIPEPWHWRYVGVENAKKIKESGLCLEEYLDSIGAEY